MRSLDIRDSVADITLFDEKTKKRCTTGDHGAPRQEHALSLSRNRDFSRLFHHSDTSIRHGALFRYGNPHVFYPIHLSLHYATPFRECGMP